MVFHHQGIFVDLEKSLRPVRRDSIANVMAKSNYAGTDPFSIYHFSFIILPLKTGVKSTDFSRVLWNAKSELKLLT